MGLIKIRNKPKSEELFIIYKKELSDKVANFINNCNNLSKEILMSFKDIDINFQNINHWTRLSDNYYNINLIHEGVDPFIVNSFFKLPQPLDLEKTQSIVKIKKIKYIEKVSENNFSSDYFSKEYIDFYKKIFYKIDLFGDISLDKKLDVETNTIIIKNLLLNSLSDKNNKETKFVLEDIISPSSKIIFNDTPYNFLLNYLTSKPKERIFILPLPELFSYNAGNDIYPKLLENNFIINIKKLYDFHIRYKDVKSDFLMKINFINEPLNESSEYNDHNFLRILKEIDIYNSFISDTGKYSKNLISTNFGKFRDDIMKSLKKIAIIK